MLHRTTQRGTIPHQGFEEPDLAGFESSDDSEPDDLPSRDERPPLPPLLAKNESITRDTVSQRDGNGGRERSMSPHRLDLSPGAKSAEGGVAGAGTGTGAEADDMDDGVQLNMEQLDMEGLAGRDEGPAPLLALKVSSNSGTDNIEDDDWTTGFDESPSEEKNSAASEAVKALLDPEALSFSGDAIRGLADMLVSESDEEGVLSSTGDQVSAPPPSVFEILGGEAEVERVPPASPASVADGDAGQYAGSAELAKREEDGEKVDGGSSGATGIVDAGKRATVSPPRGQVETSSSNSDVSDWDTSLCSSSPKGFDLNGPDAAAAAAVALQTPLVCRVSHASLTASQGPGCLDEEGDMMFCGQPGEAGAAGTGSGIAWPVAGAAGAGTSRPSLPRKPSAGPVLFTPAALTEEAMKSMGYWGGSPGAVPTPKHSFPALVSTTSSDPPATLKLSRSTDTTATTTNTDFSSAPGLANSPSVSRSAGENSSPSRVAASVPSSASAASTATVANVREGALSSGPVAMAEAAAAAAVGSMGEGTTVLASVRVVVATVGGTETGRRRGSMLRGGRKSSYRSCRTMVSRSIYGGPMGEVRALFLGILSCDQSTIRD